MSVCFTVHGIAAPQGSKTRTRYGGIREDNPRTKPWRAAVSAEAAAIMVGRELLSGPVQVKVEFVFPRPKAHFGTGRNAGSLKASAPSYVSTTPDLDKLARALGDALKGIVLRDDSQIAWLNIWKVYGEPACARVEVAEMEAALRSDSKTLIAHEARKRGTRHEGVAA